MRQLVIVLLTVVLAVVSGCAPKVVPAPTVTSPKYADFIAPVVPTAFEGSLAAWMQDRGWRFLQSGDLRNAEHEFSSALKTTTAFFPAESGLGYVELARTDAAAALPHFDRALQQEDRDVSALVGRGQALVALGREGEAISAFESAVAVDPSLTDIARRIEVLRFRGVEQDIAHARQLARAGRLDEAIAAYTSALASTPDSAFLYRELGGVERQKGDAARALELFRRAVAIDPSDARSLVQIGELLENQSDYAGATKAYEAALALEPSQALEARVEVARAHEERLKLPAEYQAIEQASQITRADLAALIGVRLEPLLQDGQHREAVLITDLSSTWAATWIAAVARAGIMEPYANHAFQPRAVVRRTDLAQAISRLLARVASANGAAGRSWSSARLEFADLSPAHLAYPAASEAVAAGVMQMGPDKTFQPSRPVTGGEATTAIDRLETLAGSLMTAKGKAGR